MLACEFRVVHSNWSILVKPKGVGLFSFTLLPFVTLFFFSGRLWSLIGMTLNRCQWNSHLHCCHPSTTIICRSGYILIKRQGYLSLTRLPMKIGDASGNEDNVFCCVSRRQKRHDVRLWDQGCHFSTRLTIFTPMFDNLCVLLQINRKCLSCT